MRTSKLLSIALSFATTACAADPMTSEDGTDGGNVVGDACESPTDDPGLGSLDRNLDGMLGIDDLDPGQAAVQAIWTDASGTKTVWRQVSSTASIWHGDGNGDLTRYGVWLPLEHPEDMGTLYTTAVFQGPVEGISAPGSFTRVSTNWDIAYIERGGQNDSEPGSIEITEVSGELGSGTVAGSSGPIEIIDYLAQAPSGDVVCVQAIAFRELVIEAPG